mgnify:CR=1 FL=1
MLQGPTKSTSGSSLSLVFAEFDFGTDLKETLTEVEQAVGQLDLPEGSDPQVSSFDFNSQPIVIATVSAAQGADPAEDEVVVAHLVDVLDRAVDPRHRPFDDRRARRGT